MMPESYDEFRTLITGVHSFYGRDISDFACDVWWQALRPYDIDAVRDAFGRHCVNPDAGQYMPKPADIVRMIGGRTIDSAQLAWSKVDRAVRTIGPYQSVVFDDKSIHRVISEMGGWTRFSERTEDEWPFVAKEFESRYRGYAMRSESPECQAVLTGIAEAHNSRTGHQPVAPVLVGDEGRCRLLMQESLDGVARVGFEIHSIARTGS